MAIYTKKGDSGQTSVFDRSAKNLKRISKDSLIIGAIGNIDEVNSLIGLVISESKNKSFNQKLQKIQSNLLVIGSCLAGSGLKLPINEIKVMEKELDDLESTLPVLANFILPGGGKTGALFHYLRTVVRRAERSVVAAQKSQKIDSEVLKYLNRLSDYLFMLARKVNHLEKIKEQIWSV